MSTPKQVIETTRKDGAKLKFVDTFGAWQNLRPGSEVNFIRRLRLLAGLFAPAK